MRLCEGCEESYNFNLVGSLDNARLGNGVRMGQVYGCWCNNNQLLNIHKLTPKMNSQFCVISSVQSISTIFPLYVHVYMSVHPQLRLRRVEVVRTYRLS